MLSLWVLQEPLGTPQTPILHLSMGNATLQIHWSLNSKSNPKVSYLYWESANNATYLSIFAHHCNFGFYIITHSYINYIQWYYIVLNSVFINKGLTFFSYFTDIFVLLQTHVTQHRKHNETSNKTCATIDCCSNKCIPEKKRKKIVSLEKNKIFERNFLTLNAIFYFSRYWRC